MRGQYQIQVFADELIRKESFSNQWDDMLNEIPFKWDGDTRTNAHPCSRLDETKCVPWPKGPNKFSCPWAEKTEAKTNSWLEDG